MQSPWLTPFRFNTGPNSQETTIVTSSGPFVIAWNFNQVKKGAVDKYEIKKYEFRSFKTFLLAKSAHIGIQAV